MKPGQARPTMGDAAAGTALALVMASVFTLRSPGLALVVTFVPGVALALAIYLRLVFTGRGAPTAERALPVFCLALAVQFFHFAEEFATGFPQTFGPLYGGEPIPETTFVAFNMAAYAVFLLAALGAIVFKRRFLLVPVLFFAVYGVLGNAITHALWTLARGSYFPGLWTSLCYWLLAPLLLMRLGLDRRETAVIFATALVALTVTAGGAMDWSALR